MAEDICLDDLGEALRKSENGLQKEIFKREAWGLKLQDQIRGVAAKFQEQFSGVHEKLDQLSNVLTNIQLQLQILERTNGKGFEDDFCVADAQFHHRIAATKPPLPQPHITSKIETYEADYFTAETIDMEEQKLFDEMLKSGKTEIPKWPLVLPDSTEIEKKIGAARKILQSAEALPGAEKTMDNQVMPATSPLFSPPPSPLHKKAIHDILHRQTLVQWAEEPHDLRPDFLSSWRIKVRF